MGGLHFVLFCIFLISGARGTLKPTNKLVVATDVSITKVPYYVNVYNGDSHCGGALLSLEYVLTAAHCVHGAKSVLVVAGRDNDVEKGVEVTASTFHTRNYSPVVNPLANDIALIKLDKPLEKSDKIAPAKLAEDYVSSGEILTVAGYKNKVGGSPHLQTYNAFAVEEKLCKKFYNREVLPPGVLCDVYLYGVRVCFGNNGSPVTNLRGEIVGVTSHNQHCNKLGPNVHTSVYYHLNFINKYVKY